MTVVKRIFWKTGLLLLLAAGGCAALYGMTERADPPDIDWQTVTPAEVETLIESGALNPNAVYTGNKGEKFSPLMRAVGGKSDLGVLDVLVRHGADMELHHGKYSGYLTPLGMALLSGDIEYARRLLELGADPVQVESITPPVFYTLKNPNLDLDHRKEMIDLLLSHGADINALDKYQQKRNVVATPLMHVVFFLIGNIYSEDHIELLSYLVSHGADINVRPAGGEMTAMDLAVWGQDADVVKELISLGGDVNIVNDEACSVPLFNFVWGGQDMEVLDILIAEGVNLDYICSTGASVAGAIAGRREKAVIYKMLGGSIVNQEKFPDEQSWRDFADEIAARIEDLCTETTYTICDELETI